MQRFSTSDLERLEAVFAAKGFTYSSKRTDERAGKAPLLTLELRGKGSVQDIHEVLRRAPFVLTDMSTKKHPDGLSVRLQLMQGKVLEDDGWQPGRAEQSDGAEFGE
jgi:hypothetical protein